MKLTELWIVGLNDRERSPYLWGQIVEVRAIKGGTVAVAKMKAAVDGGDRDVTCYYDMESLADECMYDLRFFTNEVEAIEEAHDLQEREEQMVAEEEQERQDRLAVNNLLASLGDSAA